MLPVTIGMLFLILAMWLHFTRVAAYTRSASTLAEWVARSGVYDAAIMCPAIRETLIDQVGSGVAIDCTGSGNTNTFVQIVVLNPACLATTGSPCSGSPQVIRIGGPYTGNVNPAEADCSAANPTVCPGGDSGGIGWTSQLPLSGTGALTPGSEVIVDIWGSRQSSGLIFSENPLIWLLPSGHAVGYVTADGAL